MADQKIVNLAPNLPVPVAMAERFNVPDFDRFAGPQRLQPYALRTEPQVDVAAPLAELSPDSPIAPEEAAFSSVGVDQSTTSKISKSSVSNSVSEPQQASAQATAIRPHGRQLMRMAHRHNRPDQPVDARCNPSGARIRPQKPPQKRMAHRHNMPAPKSVPAAASGSSASDWRAGAAEPKPSKSP